MMLEFPTVSFLARRPEPSRLAHYLFFCVLLVILLTSFYPYTGWRYSGTELLAFLVYPLPHYFTVFDNAINFLVYVPLGFCLARMLRRRWLAWLQAALVCTAISAAIEFIQQFMPGRISSNLDIISNAGGAVAGSLLARLQSSRRWQRLWLMWRHHNLSAGTATEWGLAWVVLWFVSQLDPTQPFLGVVVAPRGLPQAFASPIENAALFLRLLEGCGMMLNLLGVSFFVSLLVRHTAQVPRAIATLLLTAFFAKMLFAGMLLKPAQFFAWLNLNIVVGGVAGVLLLILFWRLKRSLRALAGFACLLAAQLVSIIWPLTPQFSATLPLFRWHYGHLEHFSGLANIIGDIWPIGAIGWLAYMVLRPAPDEGWY